MRFAAISSRVAPFLRLLKSLFYEVNARQWGLIITVLYLNMLMRTRWAAEQLGMAGYL